MLHYDYNWDLYPNYLKLDDELNIDRLGWQEGDLFKLEVTADGTRLLKKVDPLVKFLEIGARQREQME
jgi:hypothetical protein